MPDLIEAAAASRLAVMVKADRCALLKKESQATRKRFVADTVKTKQEQEALQKEYDKAEADRLADERAKARQASNKFDAAMKAGAGKTTFGKAAQVLKAREEVEDNDAEGEYEESEATHYTNGTNGTGTTTAAAPKKEKKMTKSERYKDEMKFLAEEQKAAIKQRVIGRLMRLFVVGFFLDAYREKDLRPVAKDSGKVKKKGKADENGDSFSIASLRDKANKLTGPFMMLLFTLFLGFLVIAGEDFDARAIDSHDVNLYEVLGVDADSDILAVRKAYKSLALSWHPDKNPGCEACVVRFAKIGEAYEVLNNPEKKKAYDQRRAPEGSLESVASVDLTAEDFESRVLRSNDVWYVEVYDSNEGMSRGFHPIWEDVAQKHFQLARFGRIDAGKHRQALRLLHQRVMMFPVVFRIARGEQPELFQPEMRSEELSSKPLVNFVMESFPQVTVLDVESELRSWWDAKRDKPRILVSGPLAQSLRGSRGQGGDFLQLQRSAFTWVEFFDIAVCELKLAEFTLGPDVVSKVFTTGKGKTGPGWSLALRRREGAVPDVRSASSLKEVLTELQELISKGLGDQAPYLTVRNYQQLCGTQQGTRTFCLLLMDAFDDARVASALEELNDSRKTFAQEALEMGNSEDGGSTEEPFHIQPVRVSLSSSRLPWQPVAAGSAFRSLWAEVEKAPVFVFEAETNRIGAVRTQSLRELFQQIAYDDMKLAELPEHFSFTRGLPDPEVPLRRELLHSLSTPLGAIGAFLLAAGAIAILPELSVPTTGTVMAVFASLVLAAWPLATRRCVSFFWCTAAPSNFECQVGA